MTIGVRVAILAAMSEENVRAVREAYGTAYAARSVEQFRERFADDFVWHNRPTWPGRSTYTADEMPQLWADLDETFSEYTLEPITFSDHGDFVLAELAQSARLRDSEAKVEETIWHLWHVVDGIPQEGWSRGSKEEALEIIETSSQGRPA